MVGRLPILIVLLAVSACGTFISTDFFGGGEEGDPAAAVLAPAVDAANAISTADATVTVDAVKPPDDSIPDGSVVVGIDAALIEDAGNDSGLSLKDSGTKFDAGICPPSCLSKRCTAGICDPYVFVTRAVYSPPFSSKIAGGTDLADAICQQEASDAKIFRTFHAWLAATTLPADLPWNRVIPSSAHYRDLAGTIIAEKFDDLRGKLIKPILIAPGMSAGAIVTVAPGEAVWTGLLFDNQKGVTTAPDDCKRWLSTAQSDLGAIGRTCSNECATEWFTSGSVGADCKTARRLYCIQDAEPAML